MTTATPTQSPPASPVRPLRFSVDDYYRLAEVGILAPEVRSELIEDAYAERPIVTRGQVLAPEAFPDLELAADAILG